MKKSFDVKEIFSRFKGLVTIGTSDIIGGGISALFWIYVATLFDADGYGQLFYFFAIGNIVSSVSLIGSKNTLLVYVPKQIKLDTSIFLLVIIIGSISSLIVFLIYSESVVGLYIFGSIVFGLGASEILGKKLYSNYFVYLMIQKFSMVGLSLGLYYLIGFNGIILGISLLFFTYIPIIFTEFKTTKIDFSLLKPRLKFMMESFGQHLTTTLWGQLDKLLIVPLLGFAFLGNFQLGLQFIAVFQLVPFIVLKYTLPHDANGNPNKNLKLLVILFSIFSAVLVIFLAPVIIPIFFEKLEYVVDIIQILAVSLIPLSVNTVYASKFLGSEKSRIFLIGHIISLLVYVLGIIVLGSIFGIIGVAISHVIGATTLSVYYVIIDKKIF